ncbi:MAG: ATP-binding protein, partial [Solirubrobacteraceae bacterium]
MSDLSGSSRLSASLPFAGRASELELLRTLLPTAEGEGRRVVLLSGEPGAGKSRLAREFATEAQSAGALVLHGECDAVVATPYGPFVPVLEQLLKAVEPSELAASAGPGAGELTRLVPGLAARIERLSPPAKADPDTERHRLHTAVGDLLAATGRRQPVVVVLDDVHWADVPTLLLLRHLARAPWTGRVLLFATFRDTQAEMPELLSHTLADLRRAEEVVRLRLAALSREEVRELVGRAVGCATTADLDGLGDVAGTISELTGGNAFLVCELWRALLETGAVEIAGGTVRVTRPVAALGTPESVREVVNERLARLAPPTTALLELAAAAGAEFELEVVRRGSGLS